MELIRQAEINIDYILMLVAKYHDSNCEDKEILVDIRKAVDSSMQPVSYTHLDVYKRQSSVRKST